MTEQLTTEQYTKLALRTESIPTELPYNHQAILGLLTVMYHVSEILDAIKKKSYYNRDIDVESIMEEHLVAIREIIGQDANPFSVDPTIIITDQKRIRTFHGLIGILTESGELASLFKNVLCGQDDVVNLKEELGDFNWYEAILCDTNDFTFDNVLARNIEKLAFRYKDKYSDFAANNRDVVTEYEILKE